MCKRNIFLKWQRNACIAFFFWLILLIFFLHFAGMFLLSFYVQILDKECGLIQPLTISTPLACHQYSYSHMVTGKQFPPSMSIKIHWFPQTFTSFNCQGNVKSMGWALNILPCCLTGVYQRNKLLDVFLYISRTINPNDQQ